MRPTLLSSIIIKRSTTKHPFLLLAIVLGMVLNLQAQVGGLFTYEFLNFAPSARISALGGTHISAVDDDINLAANNPAVLNPLMHEQLSFSHAFHPADIHYGYVTGGFHQQKLKTTFQLGVRYVNYGELDLTNLFGQIEGTFRAAEYGITLGAGRQLNERLRAGVNLRAISSQFESYNSLGLTADVGLLYQDTAKNLSFTVLARNMGYQLTTYRDNNREPLPFELQAGITKRLKYLPFQFSLVYRFLDRWNILYDDPNSEEDILFLGEAPTGRSKSSLWFDNLARHFVVNGELFIGAKDNFRLRFGYSHLLRQEMALSEYRSLAGFTYGVGIKINRFRIDYGRTTFHLAGGVNQLSIGTNLKEFR